MKKARPEDKTMALKVNEGIEQPAAINRDAVSRLARSKKNLLGAGAYIEGILRGDRVLLSQAITLVESNLPLHQKIAQEIIQACLPYSGNAVRVGITGVPGAGKSTFIEALGMYLVNNGRKLAVLTIDPSSQISKGSILGDKTRMEQLTNQPNAYIRPSASAGTLGGVARKTRETIVLCEAAGFDTVFVETVGVGQSETAVQSMVDFFLLLLIGGAGDELQGIKRGIMEMADGIVVNKADGDNLQRAERARAECENAIHLFPPPASGVPTQVLSCSAITGFNIPEVWQMIENFIFTIRSNGFFMHKRNNQLVQAMLDTVNESLQKSFYQHPQIAGLLSEMEQKVRMREISAFVAASQLIETWFASLRAENNS
ncbi:MAG TPA: methylmalonyl Co-A mutase-associated GTPase MeaB [Bacteroidales bacterium]|nr:methylmalonyl Co-A mutase-associated GTPase MeaB [Bacteroidales bacterium]